MTDLEAILSLWREFNAEQEDFVLATVIGVEGSSYRKPGACMLLAPDGRRAGTVSGGCLEAQVASRAWWLTSNGPIVERYSTVEEDGDLPYGSGCGGVVHLLLERRATAGPFLAAIEKAFSRRIPLAVAAILKGEHIGCRAFAGLEMGPARRDLPTAFDSFQIQLQDIAQRSLSAAESIDDRISIAGSEMPIWANFRSARPGLCIFGAGDDAKPLLSMAKELGWFVSVADGRSHLATHQRFPSADHVSVLEIPRNVSGHVDPAFARLQPQDAVVILTHSFEQDARVLASLLALETPLAYIGVLGPQRRTRELLAEVARVLKLPSASASDAWIEQSLSRLHAPMGLDLGAESPEAIALSVLAEIQQSLTAATAHPLREVRGLTQAIHG